MRMRAAKKVGLSLGFLASEFTIIGRKMISHGIFMTYIIRKDLLF
ncbi:hypothetical protein [Paenibacillus shirakamiensis]|nr:hypothetical protein [Paenibacillus shirakamiensis]